MEYPVRRGGYSGTAVLTALAFVVILTLAIMIGRFVGQEGPAPTPAAAPQQQAPTPPQKAPPPQTPTPPR